MSTESVALLFTDMVGSTALYQRLSPEDADQVRRDHFGILRRTLAGTGGAEVKNLGDGLMGVFSSASAALACAVSMQQAIEQDNRSREDFIELRIGLSGGEVVHEDGDYFGDPVIEAARLCAACAPGQILAAELVRMMAGRRSQAVIRPIGRLTLKGLSDPFPAVEVRWEPLPPARSDIPLPTRLATRRVAAGTDMVGREAELAAISAATKRVFAGEGREVVLVSGEPGQGKTTLVAEAARLAFEDGACVLFGHSEEDLATPYGLFAEAFDHYAAHAREERLLELAEAHGSEWGRFVPAFVERSPQLAPSKATDPDSERYLLFAAAADLLMEMARDDPLVLVLDDLQWADPGSLALLRHLTAADDHCVRLLIAGVFRASEVPGSSSLRATLGMLWRHRGVSRLELGALDGSGVESLLEAVTGGPLDAFGVGLAEVVHRETAGNPYFVTEMLRHLVDTGAIAEHPPEAQVAADLLQTVALPTSVREVIGGRVVRLGADASRVLSTAAVIGRDFDLDLLHHATQLPVESLLDILDAAVGAALVSEVDGTAGRYAFSHALVQRTLYDDLGPTRRSFTHERVAVALEAFLEGEPDARVGELARHWMAAPRPASLVNAIRYSHEAAVVALDSLAPGDAVRHYLTALELCAELTDTDPAFLVDLATGLGTAQRQIGDPSFRDTLLGAARDAARLGDVGRLVAACLANDRGFYSAVGATDKEKVDALELALAELDGDHPDRSLILATLCSELAHGSSLERRRALADEAIDIAERSGGEEVVVRVLNHLHVPLQVPSMLELTEARAAEGLARAERVGDPVLVFWAAQWRLESAARTGDLEEMDRCIAIHGAVAETLGQPIFSWGHSFVQSLRAQIAGDVELAERHATEAVEIGTDGGQPDATLIYGAQMNIVAGQRGTQHELVPLIEKMAEETPDIPRSFFLSLLAKAHVEGDQTAPASELLVEFAASGYELPLNQVWLTGMVDFADAVIECNEPVHAAPLFDRLEPWADQLPATGASALGPVSHYLGGLSTVLGRFDRANAYFEQSSKLCRQMKAKFFAARTNLLWARMLTLRNEPGEADLARKLLEDSRDVAAAQSYAVVERRANAALAKLTPPA